ncbi:putative nucleic acid-binding protein [Dinghuibacter silviterrae]|uniref:Putative nucleic acid-binding protein n=2 Tax=Dinghuibacter silviterrae TaxID=1539049 RepID=A0A4R8DI84_9BACT|nr:putative nucleic acid-binding protein [Dinghuibacter silviterrae]
MQFITAVLDANVLYPLSLRDYLLNLAVEGLYDPIWTPEIHDEWIRNLLKNRPDLKRKQLEATRKAMDKAFPGANVTNVQSIANRLALPDPDDRHVLAAAIKAGAEVIVTANLRDFPEVMLAQHNIRAEHPDSFILSCIERDHQKSVRAFEEQVAVLRNPTMTVDEVLKSMEKNRIN